MKTRKANKSQGLLILVAAAALFLGVSQTAAAASATALVSANVLGPAETEIASGAVTLSRVSDVDSVRIDPAAPRRSETRREVRNLSSFRVGGGFNASYAVTLPETVTARSGSAEIAVTGFRSSGVGRLSAEGTATVGVGVSVSIPAGQLPGTYTGSYPVTIAYN